MDENYQTYLNRVMRLTLPETHRSQAQHLQESPKFQRSAEGWQATPFPGFAVVTPAGKDDQKNVALYDYLHAYQRQLQQQIGADILALVPPDSFHLTLADLIWDSAYRHACETPGFDQRLRDRVASSFRQCEPMANNAPLRFQVLGLMVMTRAIALCLAPTDEDAYDRVIRLRRAIYQNPDVIELGIEQQYYFTPHITLGYFGELEPNLDKAALVQSLDALNQQWIGSSFDFWVYTAEVRKFDDMATYFREPDWATFEF
ncbi:DUF1868 domain-containing protein [Myxacorys almedinensis A]|uniref:DUF1868 domain-containing protein n=1 Tax=Myxacorys almedinensis A TaxID=2690445 RepID=A0A8J7Z102_9CYAN|nr:DUF1868 domain-containing protein [Myxacorys almedinensis A]